MEITSKSPNDQIKGNLVDAGEYGEVIILMEMEGVET